MRLKDEGSDTSHVVIVLVVQYVGDEQNDRGVAEILPPVRGLTRLAAKIAGLVHDWASAITGKLVDFALLDIDQCRPICVTVPRHDSTRGDRQLAETQFVVLDLGRLPAEIDGPERDVGYAESGQIDRLAGIRLDLVGRAF